MVVRNARGSMHERSILLISAVFATNKSGAEGMTGCGFWLKIRVSGASVDF